MTLINIKGIICPMLIGMLFFIGCERSSKPRRAGIYLSRVVYQHNVDQVRHYHYNENLQLSMREYVFNDIVSEKFNYQYHGGKIVRIDYYGLNSNDDYTLYPKEYLLYDYDLSEISRATLYPDLSFTEYEYENGRIKKAIQSSGSYTGYQYDSRGNITEMILYKDGRQHWSFKYEYDNRKNPFYEVEPIHESFAGVDFIRYKCPNNLIYEMFINENNDIISKQETIYKYNSDDLPVQAIVLYTSEMNGYDRDTTNTLLFEYEVITD